MNYKHELQELINLIYKIDENEEVPIEIIEKAVELTDESGILK